MWLVKRLCYGSVTLDSMFIPMDTIGVYVDTLQIEVTDTGWLSLTFCVEK